MLALLLLFVLIVVLVRFRLPIGLALIAGAIFLGVFYFGIGEQFWMLLYHSLIHLESWKLVLTVSLILTFAYIFESAGFVENMVGSLKSFLSPRWVSRVAPAIIGLLPMPGGAMVSAPIVKLMGDKSDITPEQYTAANYWWRHVWETTWPLYPNIILAAAVMQVSVWNVAMINFPISLSCIAAGFILKPIGDKNRSSERFDALSLWNSLWPILLIVVLGLVLKIDLVISVIAVLTVVILYRHIKVPVIIDGLKKGFSLDIMALIFGVMTLMIAIDETGAAKQFYDQLLYFHIPPALVVFTVPFVIGFLAGITSAYIGVGFPVIFPLIGTAALSQSAGMLLAFAGGYMGVMMSPVHLCLVLTSEYFKASLWKTLYLIIIPMLITSIISLILAFTLYR
jgi:uncharacterized protein